MRMTRTALLCAALGLALASSGCGEKPGNTSSSGSAAVTVSPSASAAPASEKQETIRAYYGDSNISELVQKDTIIRYSKAEDKYLAALQALKTSPSAEAVSLCPNFTFRSAKLQGGTLTVDLSFTDKDRLGSGGEALLLEALKNTVFQFPEVTAVEFLVDGKKTDSLMGHMELQYPFKRNSK